MPATDEQVRTRIAQGKRYTLVLLLGPHGDQDDATWRRSRRRISDT